jgi:5-oxoprolinase (ATP-hydrolysing)
MHAVQENAAQSVCDLLKQFAVKLERGVLREIRYNDDGIPFKLKITIDKDTGDAVFDFTGTGAEYSGNLNAPPTCSYSVIMVSESCKLLRRSFSLQNRAVPPAVDDVHRDST